MPAIKSALIELTAIPYSRRSKFGENSALTRKARMRN